MSQVKSTLAVHSITRSAREVERTAVNGMRRVLFGLAASCCFVLAFLGALLPLLPTTPFLLLGFYCLSRVSSRWHQRLLRSHWATGVREWKEHRAISPSTRRTALASIAIVAALAFWGGAADAHVLMGVSLGTTIGVVALLRVPVRREVAGGEKDSPTA
ncbi:MAG: DUF454 family protein [Planctomycetales bacterium]|nr:DUF454 family protein [Planctomycetales bacterium]